MSPCTHGRTWRKCARVTAAQVSRVAARARASSPDMPAAPTRRRRPARTLRTPRCSVGSSSPASRCPARGVATTRSSVPAGASARTEPYSSAPANRTCGAVSPVVDRVLYVPGCEALALNIRVLTEGCAMACQDRVAPLHHLHGSGMFMTADPNDAGSASTGGDWGYRPPQPPVWPSFGRWVLPTSGRRLARRSSDSPTRMRCPGRLDQYWCLRLNGRTPETETGNEK